MKSNGSENSQERIVKATESLWKILWFSLYIIVFPTLVAIVFFFIFNFLITNTIISAGLSIITFLFALLLFYRPFDKYRKKSIFLNKINNPRSRIHITFIITILSLVVTPLFLFFTPEYLRINEFELLPLIGFAVLYPIVYFYYFFQPIDYFNMSEKEFKHFNKSEQVLKQPHNIILLINYIIHVIFLSISFNTGLSWLFALITNIIFYLVALNSTKSYSKKIEDAILKDENILQDLVFYKRNFVKTVLALDFILLIQLPFDILGAYAILGISLFTIYDIINATFLSLIFVIFNFKLTLYITTYYQNQLQRLGVKEIQENKYFKQNFILSLLLICLILSFSFVHQLPLSNLLFLPIIYIITRAEEKTGFITRNLSRHIHLLNSFVLLATISFILIPQIFSDLQGALWPIQFIIFFISSYFLLQIFVGMDYYEEKNILITQNILAVVSFYFLIYFLFPNLTLDFISFTNNPFFLFISEILLPGLIGILFSLYLLYLRHFYKKSWKILRVWFVVNFLSIISIVYYLVNIRSFQLLSYEGFYQNLALSSILIPAAYIIFSLFNNIIHLFTRESCINNIYNSIWVLIFSIFASLIVHSLGNVPAILLDFVLLSIMIHLVLIVGKKIGKITEKSYTILFSINGFLIITETFFMSSQYFILNVGFERIIAYFFSTCIVCLIINLGGSSKSPFIKKVKTAITSFTIGYGWVILEWLYFMFNYQGVLFLYGLLIITAITTVIPLGYLAYVKILKRKIFVSYCFIALNVIVVTLFSFITHILLLFYLEYSILGISSAVIFLIGCYIGIFKVGVKIGYIQDTFYQQFLKNIYYPLGIALFIIFNELSLKYLPPPFNQPSFSILTSLFLMSGLTNFANLRVKSVDSINTKITSITLFYGEALIWFYTIGNMSNLFVPVIPPNFELDFINLYFSLIFIFISSSIPFYYIAKKNVINQEKFNKYAYFSLYFLILLAFLFISSIFFYYLFDFYMLALIGDIIYITIALYYLIKHGFKKKYLKPIHISKRTAIILYSVLFIEIYAFLVTMFLLFTVLDFWISCYLSFIIIGTLVMLLSNQGIIFSISFSKIINLMSLIFTSGIFSYASYEYLTKGTTFQWIIPFLVFSVIFLIAINYALKNKLHVDIFKKLLVVNGIILSLLIISLPTFTGYEFIRLGIQIDTFYIIISTIILIYVFLKYLEFVFDNITLKESNRLILKVIQLTIWISISLLISFKIFLTLNPSQINQFFYFVLCCSSLAFLTLNLNALNIIDDIKQRVFENQELKLDFYKIYKIYEFYKNFSFFAIILAISGLITSLFYPLLGLIPIPSVTFLPVIMQSAFFSLVFLLLTLGTQSMEIEFEKTRTILLLSSWSVVKVITCFILFIYLSLLSFFIALSTSILVFSFLSPITINLIRNVIIIHNRPNKVINSIMIISFYGALLSLYVQVFWNIMNLMPFFVINNTILIALLICNFFFYLNYVAMRLGEIKAVLNRSNLLNLYLKSFLALIPFFYSDSPLGIVLWLIAVIILLSRRNKNLIVKWVTYLLFAFTGLVVVVSLMQPYSLFFVAIQDPAFLLISNSILIIILLISINLNLKMMNNIEKYVVYFLLSTLSYIGLYNFLPPLYNVSISLLIFLVLMGNFYYRKKDPRYKLFIRPCVVLSIFDLTSFIFYGFMFNNPPFTLYQSILSFTSTFSLTGFTFVSLYNESPQRFRKLSYFIVLPAIIIAIPVFIYFFTISIYPIIELWIPLVLSINVGIFLFYLAIGIYQWKISWAIWKTGFWLWILFPVVNYALIARAFTGIDDVATRALNLFGFNIPGSYLLAFVVCVLVSFPFWYTWIKEHFSTILFGMWAINLALLYWFSQNIFSWNEFLLNSSFGLFAIFLLMPIIYKLKFWKVLMVFWIIFTFVSISFINFVFIEVGLYNSIIPVDITITGISCFFLSYFPNMRTKRNFSLLISYLVLTTGIALIVFDLMYLITGGNPWTSLELTLIITSASLFSSRLFKMNKIVINFLISWTLLLSFSFLTYHTFILIEGFEWNALFLALVVGGLTFFIFNRYKMIWGPYERLMPISSLFAYLAISLGVSLTISSLILLILPYGAWFLIMGLFLLTNLIFLTFKLHNYRFLVWYMMPIAVTLLLLQGFIFFTNISAPITIILSGVLLYTLICQLTPISKNIKPIFALILYFDATILSSSVLIELGIIDTFLILVISLTILFVLTLLDLYVFRRDKKWYISLINLMSYLGASINLFIFALQFISGANNILIWLYVFLFLLLQNYSIHVFFSILKSMNKYEVEKLNLYKSNSYLVLSNTLYLLVCVYGALQINSNLTQVYAFQEFTSIFLFLTLFSLFFLILNSIFNQKMKTKSMYTLKLSIFIIFQISLLLFWILALIDLQFLILTLNSISIFWFSLIALIETILATYPLNLMKKNSVDESSKIKFQKYYTAIHFCIYVELSILAYGFFNLFLDIFASLLFSQILLFIISLIEIYSIKGLREILGYIMHIFSLLMISGSYIFYIFDTQTELHVIFILPIILLQFYSNYAYYNMRRINNPEKANEFELGAIKRQKLIGNVFYLGLILCLAQYLIFIELQIIQISIIISVFIHILVLIDRVLLIFLGRLSKPFLVISLASINIVSFILLIDLVLASTIQIIPILIFIIEIELFYLTKLTGTKKAVKNFLIAVLYFNFSSWPLYFMTTDIVLDLNLILFAFIILLIFLRFDKSVGAFNENFSKRLKSISLLILGLIIPIDTFLLLNNINPDMFFFNAWTTLLVATLEFGIIYKPYKRKRNISFLYTLVVFLEIFSSLLLIDLTSLGISIFVIGILIYLFVFLMEELKAFFNNFVDYIRRALLSLRTFISKILHGIYDFIKRSYVVIKIISCAGAGIIIGYVFSTPLNILQSSLLGAALFGVLLGLLPTKRTDDIDIIFRTRMTRFGTVWISMTAFILVFILPALESGLLGMIIVLSSLLALGAIVAIYVYRIEKKQKISIKWRFYITTTLIITVIIWAILIAILYFMEVNV